jgi:suppressor of G2 allele of SKP1
MAIDASLDLTLTRQVIYENGETQLILEPLKGDVDPDNSDFTVGKVKVEIRLAKKLHAQGRWGKLVADPSDVEGTLCVVNHP